MLSRCKASFSAYSVKSGGCNQRLATVCLRVMEPSAAGEAVVPAGQPTTRQRILKILGIVLAAVLAAFGGIGVALGLWAN